MITKMQNIIIVLLALSGTALYAADEQGIVEHKSNQSSARRRYEARLGRKKSTQKDLQQKPKKSLRKDKKKKKHESVVKDSKKDQKNIRTERLAKKRAQAAERKKMAAQAEVQVQQKVSKRPVRRRKHVVQPEPLTTEKPVKKQRHTRQRRTQDKKQSVTASPVVKRKQPVMQEDSATLTERVNRLISYVQHKEEERLAREQYKKLQRQSYLLQKELGH